MDNKPDNVCDNPNLVPYGTNVGAPAIKVDDISNWKVTKVNKVNKNFDNTLVLPNISIDIKNKNNKINSFTLFLTL